MNAPRIRVAVVGTGEFGRNHARVYSEMPHVELVGVVDTSIGRAAEVASEFNSEVLPGIESLAGIVDAVSVAVPTAQHAEIGCKLLRQGIDVLVEKPMAASLRASRRFDSRRARIGTPLAGGASRAVQSSGRGRRSNYAPAAFFEVHRLGIFTPRSLDIDVVFDVMIHDLDILLALVGEPVTDVKAVGIPVVSEKVDIAHARLEFASGAVANVTASRVSTERVRKMRFFQEKEYVSLDYARQDALRVRVAKQGPPPEFGFEKLPTVAGEPLRAELNAFVESVRTRQIPRVDGAAGRRALELADRVAASILEHGRRVQLSAFAFPVPQP